MISPTDGEIKDETKHPYKIFIILLFIFLFNHWKVIIKSWYVTLGFTVTLFIVRGLILFPLL